ncbi:MAG: MFS transporter [Anaerolineae bacterium]|nr:MFS transporter [Thermoflexales bacterium]MDW8408570.1 MFS transporter [Anaerolineae bacterium]
MPERARRPIAVTLAYYIGFIALGLTTASLGPTLPGLAEQTQTRLSEISLLFTARSFGYLLGSLLSGRLYDRFRGHLLLACGLAGMAAALGMVPLMSVIAVLVAVLFVIGAMEGFLDVGANTLIVWVHREKVGPFMNGLHFFFGFGAFLSPLLVAQTVLWSGGIAGAYWALAALIIPIAMAIGRLPSPPILRGRTAGGETERMPYRVVGLTALFFFLYVGAEVGFAGWIFTYVTQLRLADETTAALINSVFWGALTLGRLASIPLAMRFSPRALLATDLIGGAISAGVMVALPDQMPALWVGAFGLGLCMASIFPTMLSLAGTRMPMTGKINGIFFAASSAGGMSVPWLIGQLFERIGPQSLMWAILTSMALASAMFVMLERQAAPRGEAAHAAQRV